MDTCPKEVRLPGYRVTGLLDASVEDLLAEHRRQVNEWVAEWRKPLPTASLADAPPVFRAVNTHSANKRLLTSASASNLGFALIILALGAGLAGWGLGFTGPAPWLGMIVLLHHSANEERETVAHVFGLFAFGEAFPL
jgi:hypothetical protein